MWGLVLSALTIGVSLLGKKEGDEKSSASDRQVALTGNTQTFLSGIVLAMGMSLLYASVLQQFRFVERFRLSWNDWWDWGRTHEAPLRVPMSIMDTSDFIQTGDDGSVRLLVSPKHAATSTLHVSLVTLQPGREIPSKKTVGVEFYYVVSGKGRFSQSGVVETLDVAKGDGFVVDSRSIRWISNSKGKEELVLLRATDAGNRYSQSTFDHIRRDPNLRSTMGYVTDSLRQVSQKAKDYVKSNGIDVV